MWSMNIGKPVNIPKLNEAMAIELGAELVGETVIFSIAAGKGQTESYFFAMEITASCFLHFYY